MLLLTTTQWFEIVTQPHKAFVRERTNRIESNRTEEKREISDEMSWTHDFDFSHRQLCPNSTRTSRLSWIRSVFFDWISTDERTWRTVVKIRKEETNKWGIHPVHRMPCRVCARRSDQRWIKSSFDETSNANGCTLLSFPHSSVFQRSN